MSPQLTLIIPAYNAEHHLSTCLNDLMAQSYTDFEALIMDDGSTDNTATIGKTYARRDPRFVVIRLPHGGVSTARNRGLELAKGNYVGFIDCDDRTDPHYLAEFFSTPLPLNAAIVYQGVVFEYIDQNRTEYYTYPSIEEGGGGIAEIIVHNKLLRNGWICSKILSLNTIQKHAIRFDTSISIHEDHLFMLEYLCHVKQIKLRSEALYHYQIRDNGESLSQQQHTANELAHVGSQLIACTEKLARLHGITDVDYLREAISEHGLKHLIHAASQAEVADSRRVFHTIASHRHIFKLHSDPKMLRHPIVGRKMLQLYFLLPEELHLVPHTLIRLRHLWRRLKGRPVKF